MRRVCNRPQDWIRDVVFILRNRSTGRISLKDLYHTMGITTPNVHYESSLYEHPSIVLDEDDVLSFVPFASFQNKAELLQFFADTYPCVHPRHHFLHIYDHVEADIDELVFEGKLWVLNDAVVYASLSPLNLISQRHREMWSSEAKDIRHILNNNGAVCNGGARIATLTENACFPFAVSRVTM